MHIWSSLLALAILTAPDLGCSQSAPEWGGAELDQPISGSEPSGASALAACTGRRRQPLDGTWDLDVGGLQRKVYVHVPWSYNPAKPTPLVLNFHGYRSNAIQQVLLTGMTLKADSAGFVVAHAEGTGNPQGWNGGTCCGDWANGPVDDIALVRAIIKEAGSRLCLDTKRVYATGFSNGGFLSHRIACELSDQVAAVASVAGMNGMAPEACKPERPVPVLHFHGTDDSVVPYAGNAYWPSAKETFAGWAARNRCTDDQPTETYRKGEVDCSTYSKCAGSAAVTLCTIDTGGHSWPGAFPIPGHKTTRDINATAEIWNFFQSHPMP